MIPHLQRAVRGGSITMAGSPSHIPPCRRRLAAGLLVLAAAAAPWWTPCREVAAQPPQRPVPDDPFAEELNPFPKGEAEKDKKPRSGKTPRTPGRTESTKDDARGPSAARETTPKDRDSSPIPVPKDPKDDAAGKTRPRATPMRPGADLVPFPDAGTGLEADSDSPATPLLEKAEKLDRRGRFAEAKEAILEAIEKDPKLPLAYLALGIVTRHMGDFDASVDACSRGLRLDPMDPELYLRRGIAWFHLGRHGIALEDFEDAAGIAYEDPRPELWRGLTLMELDRPLEAISAYSSAIRRDRAYDLAYLNRGLAYLASGEPSKAEVDFDHAIRHDPRDARAWFNRGVAQARQGEYANAVDSYGEALRLDPRMEAARRNLDATRGKVTTRVGRPGSAVVPAAETVPPGRPLTRVTSGGR